eukprot:Opistho-2@96307
MSVAEAPCYTLINPLTDAEGQTEQQLRKELEAGTPEVKTAALKRLIVQMINGDRFPSLLMIIVKFVMPLRDHIVKKLLLLYWEILPKTGTDGKLLREMILVCDAYRKDLQHPNEFIRGSTLRFLCKLKAPELLEPVMPAIRACLEHRHAYVRRNAVLAIFTIHKNFENLIPDAPELIQNFLIAEQDMSCKRNAFMMLVHVDQPRALDYLATVIDQVQNFGDIMQLVIVELIHKVCRTNPTERARFIRCIYTLLNAQSAAVRYDAAGTLITLSSAPTAVKAAAATYIDLIVKESDNNVKLIVLDRLADLKRVAAHEKVLQDVVMDVMRVLAAPDLDVRKKTLALVLELVTPRNVEEVVLVLKKELSRSSSGDDFDKSGDYKQLLVQALHTCGIKHPSIAASIVPMLMDYVGDTNAASASDVVHFVREAIERFPKLRPQILQGLLQAVPQIKAGKVFRVALWIAGEYAEATEEIEQAFAIINESLGELPIVDSLVRAAAGDSNAPDAPKSAAAAPAAPTARLLASDGSYASQSALTSSSRTTESKVAEERPSLRTLLIAGDFFLGAVLSAALVKLSLRYTQLLGADGAKRANKVAAEALLSIASIIHLGQSGLTETPIDEDSRERMNACLRTLTEPTPLVLGVFEHGCREAFSSMLQRTQQAESAAEALEKARTSLAVQPDDLIAFRQLGPKSSAGAEEDVFAASLLAATGANESKDKSTSKLNKVFQLTGFSDPVYAEAYVNVNQYDIVLDVLVVNQTGDTLQSLSLELATLGDLKLVERPTAYTLGPHDVCNIRANVKVSSTENGIIFGNIVYDLTGSSSDRNCVVLNDIHIDVMDYITPGDCTDADFRRMWVEFEWENKVAVATVCTDLNQYLRHIIGSTNMRCLTPESALAGDCGFLAANLYARSIFGEDALANVSIERTAEGKIAGHIRIRSKTQGIALSLGDKITHNQEVIAA